MNGCFLLVSRLLPVFPSNFVQWVVLSSRPSTLVCLVGIIYGPILDVRVRDFYFIRLSSGFTFGDNWRLSG